MVFDFYRIVGSEDSKQENFSCLCSRLVMNLFPSAKPINGKGGDEGIDTLLGQIDGECHIFQHKYFIDKIGPSQRKQIEKSLITAIKKHDLKKWILMLPKDFNTSELRWFEGLKTKYKGIEIDWWGKTKLQDLLSKFSDIVRDYQPQDLVNIIILSNNEFTGKKITKIEGEGLPDIPKSSEDVLKSVLSEIKGRINLRILVLGPNSSNQEIFKKRCEIRDAIITLGHEAHFFEEIINIEILQRSGLNLSVAEIVLAKSYDYIICLMSSAGTISEVHDFAKRSDLVSKMMICIDSQYRQGYTAQSIIPICEGGNAKVDWYEYPRDIKDCYLQTRVLDQIQNVAQRKQWEIAIGEP